ncbi:MAG: hypothetical protein ACK4I8_05060 [Armatimonadota bacterium]
MSVNTHNLILQPTQKLGQLREEGSAPLEGAVWYVAENVGDGLAYFFPEGSLAEMNWLTADMILDGKYLVVFVLTLQEGESGPAFRLVFGALNQCQARIRVPLEAVKQNRWRYPREGAWLKPMCGGDVVDLKKVDRMTLTVVRKSEEPARWCLTPFVATFNEPTKLTKPLLLKGPLLDEFGQSTLHDWATKTRSESELIERLKSQLETAPNRRFPESYSRWGGWKELRFEATGYFRTHHDGERWWLIDPDGYAFWSIGLDCVRPDTDANIEGLEDALSWLPEQESEFKAAFHVSFEKHRHFNYLVANFIRAFGPDRWYDHWAKIVLSLMREWGFNTVANWSDWRIASREGFPYVRPLNLHVKHVPYIFRDFPDVFHPDFEQDATEFAEPLRETAEDPAFIGYFLMNEPTWGFAKQLPAEGMLLTTPSCETRKALSDFLRKRYSDSNAALSASWGVDVTFAEIAEGEWRKPITQSARSDLAEFSTLMVKRLYETLSRACKQVDPNHLNLGARYYTVPPDWAVEGMKCFDVFSINCYMERVPADKLAPLSEKLGMPIMIGEWHFGALDVGLPASGIGRVPNQEERGKAFRVYVETAAAEPWCVGVHWFTLYDQSAIGRFDGENYNIGFLDVCNRPYEQMVNAAQLTHQRLYKVAVGQIPPYNEPVQYLPKLFL